MLTVMLTTTGFVAAVVLEPRETRLPLNSETPHPGEWGMQRDRQEGPGKLKETAALPVTMARINCPLDPSLGLACLIPG